MLLTLGLGALIGGIGGAIVKGANQYGTNAQQQAYELEKQKQQFGYDTALKEQQFGYDTALKTQQFGYDTALSAQNAQQELAKQMQQQEYDKMMSDTAHQREVADMKAAGINPALAGGGLSSTNAQASAPTAQTGEQPQTKTSARQTEKQAKKELLTTLQSAYASGILKEATKKIETLSGKLAKQPKNLKLKKALDAYTMKVYNLMV